MPANPEHPISESTGFRTSLQRKYCSTHLDVRNAMRRGQPSQCSFKRRFLRIVLHADPPAEGVMAKDEAPQIHRQLFQGDVGCLYASSASPGAPLSLRGAVPCGMSSISDMSIPSCTINFPTTCSCGCGARRVPLPDLSSTGRNDSVFPRMSSLIVSSARDSSLRLSAYRALHSVPNFDFRSASFRSSLCLYLI